MADLKVKFEGQPAEYAKASGETNKVIGHASRLTMEYAEKEILRRGRAEIARAGRFGQRWQEGLTVKVYPLRGEAIDEKLYVNHKEPLAGVFEEGAVIRGRPLLWIPFSNTPDLNGRRPTARLWIARYGQLVYRPGRRPTLSQSIGGKLVPRFYGIDRVSIRRKWHIGDVVSGVADELPNQHQKNVRSA